MDNHQSQRPFGSPSLLLGAAALGLLCAWLEQPWLMQASELIADGFLRLLKLVSLPIIFLSLVTTLSGVDELAAIRQRGGRVFRYTLLTTVIAAGLALLLYTFIDPARATHELVLAAQSTQSAPVPTTSYWHYLRDIIPTNIIEPFYDHHVISVLLLALLFSAAILSLQQDHKVTLHGFFSSLLAAVMSMTRFILKLMPLAIWAFATLFAKELGDQRILQGLALYLLCVLLANLLQALLVLPALLKMKGVAPLQAAKAMWPALTVAFFTKSSSAALPIAVDCAEQRLGLSSWITRFSMPLCITINMNACAAFILITVLFVSQSNGVDYSIVELIVSIFIATLAAIGNAGIPMGCYMLSSALLSAMGVPLQLMIIILPFYAFIDMLESAINVWSDACVTAVVDKDLQTAGQIHGK